MEIASVLLCVTKYTNQLASFTLIKPQDSTAVSMSPCQMTQRKIAYELITLDIHAALLA